MTWPRRVLSRSHFRGMPQYPFVNRERWYRDSRLVRTSLSPYVDVNGEIMTRWATTIFLFLMTRFFVLAFSQHRDRESLCESQQTCASCLQTPRCVWCSMMVMNIYDYSLETNQVTAVHESTRRNIGREHLRDNPSFSTVVLSVVIHEWTHAAWLFCIRRHLAWQYFFTSLLMTNSERSVIFKI